MNSPDQRNNAALAADDDAFAATGTAYLSHDTLFNTLYPEHLATLQRRLQQQLEHNDTDLVVLTAGSPDNHLFDDQPTSFRANPHLRQWLPFDDCAGAALILRANDQPELLFLQPNDYWHQVPGIPAWAEQNLAVQPFASPEALRDALTQRLGASNHVAMIGATVDHAAYPGVASNPDALLAMMDFDRGCKTAFEQQCMTLATRRAVTGHLAARAQFRTGNASEFDIHCAYLQASLQTESDLPYGNIVALNQHAAVLHYQHQARTPPQPLHSLLIDAGARCHGYASDITRTYAARPGVFADLIEALDREQLALIDTISVGQSYVDLHVDMHRRIARLLVACGLLRCSADEAFERGLTETFLPHGLGHLIGLQTHDVAGQTDRAGHTVPPPERYGALRMTRTIEAGQVFTIEPGIYCIDLLLEPLLAGSTGKLIDQTLLAELRPHGGIRIEDNVTVMTDGVHNSTRLAFAEQQQST